MIDTFPALLPLHFFGMTLQAKEGKRLRLPSTAELLGEDSFADVFFTWEKKGVLININVGKPFEEASYPDFAVGDSVELFLDTRDLKTAGFATKFCHRFLFLPKEVQGIQCQELSHFRTEDAHPLCDPSDLSCKTEFSKKAFSMEISLPAAVLHGYDPLSFARLGFTYKINAPGRDPQHFSVSSHFYKIEQNPSLWSTILL